MRRRLRDESGANAVEFALVLPILIVLLFGIFTVALSYDAKLSLSHGARDASRFAATLPFTSSGGNIPDSWFTAIKDRVLAASTGEAVDDGSRAGLICVAYIESVQDDPATGPDESYSKVESSTWTTSVAHNGSAPCYPDTIPSSPAGASNAHVQVRVQREATVDIVFAPVLTPLLTADSVVRFEGKPTSEGG